MQKIPDDSEAAVGVSHAPPTGEGPSASLGRGPALPTYRSPMTRPIRETNMLVMGTEAYDAAQMTAYPGFRVHQPLPRHTQWAGEWHRESTFSDDAPQGGTPTGPRRFHTQYEAVCQTETRPQPGPRLTAEPEILSTFTRLLTSETTRSYMMDLVKQTLPGLLDRVPVTPCPSPRGVGRGGPPPDGVEPVRTLIPEPRAPPVMPPLEFVPPLPPNPPPKTPTPPPPPAGEGEPSDEEREEGAYGGTSARAVHQSYIDALGWLGVAVPEVQKTPASGVLAAASSQAPRTGIPLQPDVLRGARENWRTPHSTSAVHKKLDLIHRMLPEETLCLASHPPANSLVVSAAVLQGRSPAAATASPAGKEEKLLDTFGKKVYSNASLHLRQANGDAILAAANHKLWEKLENFGKYLPEECQNDFLEGVEDAQHIAQLQMNSAVYHIDTSSRAMCIGVDMRRQAWLKSTTLQQEAHDRVVDLPFDGKVLFAPETDSLLERCTTGAKTAKSLTPISRPAPKQQSSSSGGNYQQGSSSTPGFRGFMKRQKAREDKGNRPHKKKGGPSPTPRSSGPAKKD